MGWWIPSSLAGCTVFFKHNCMFKYVLILHTWIWMIKRNIVDAFCRWDCWWLSSSVLLCQRWGLIQTFIWPCVISKIAIWSCMGIWTRLVSKSFCGMWQSTLRTHQDFGIAIISIKCGKVSLYNNQCEVSLSLTMLTT